MHVIERRRRLAERGKWEESHVHYCWFDARIHFLVFFSSSCLSKWCIRLVRLSDHTSRSSLLFDNNNNVIFFFSFSSFVLPLLDSCDERVMRKDVDDNKSNDQENDEIIKDMKYDFFFFPTPFFLFFLIFSSLCLSIVLTVCE
jgi:hypothetical protein